MTQERIIKELKASRRIKASESNWLMFSATIEAALLEFTGECDLKPIHYALKRHKEWYKEMAGMVTDVIFIWIITTVM